MGLCDIYQCSENNFQYDFVDLSYDDYKLFSYALQVAIDQEFSLFDNRLNRDRELAGITAMQREITSVSLSLTKAQVFDQEVARIKNELLWNSLLPTDRIDTIFWQDNFDTFVSFSRRTGRTTMVSIFEMESDELKQAGFSPDYISKIISTIRQWAEVQLNLDTSEIEKNEQIMPVSDLDEDEVTDVPNEILSMFFSEEVTAYE